MQHLNRLSVILSDHSHRLKIYFHHPADIASEGKAHRPLAVVHAADLGHGVDGLLDPGDAVVQVDPALGWRVEDDRGVQSWRVDAGQALLLCGDVAGLAVGFGCAGFDCPVPARIWA